MSGTWPWDDLGKGILYCLQQLKGPDGGGVALGA